MAIRRPRIGARIAAGCRVFVLFARSDQGAALWRFAAELSGPAGAEANTTAVRAAVDYLDQLDRWYVDQVARRVGLVAEVDDQVEGR